MFCAINQQIDTYRSFLRNLSLALRDKYRCNIGHNARDKSINRRVARSANLINNYRLEEETPHNGDTSFWRNPPKINEPIPEGTALRRLLPPDLPRPSHAISSSLIAARRHGAPCGGCGKNPRRTRINAIMNLSRWDLTIQDVAAILPPHLPTRLWGGEAPETLSPAFLVYTKTDFVDYMDRDDVTQMQFARPRRECDNTKSAGIR